MFWQDHFDRLFASAKTLEIPVSYSVAGLEELVRKIINKNSVRNGSVRLTITAGAAGTAALAANGAVASGPTLVIFTRQPLAYTAGHYQHGLKAGFVKIRRNEHSSLVRLKTINYLENLLAKKEAHLYCWDEALFLNTAGNLAEGAVSNIFLVKNERVVTPSDDQGLLPGVMRKVVLSKCACLGIPAEERVVALPEVFVADECFLTNALMGVMPLVKINGRTIGDGRPGMITRKLNQAVNTNIIG